MKNIWHYLPSGDKLVKQVWNKKVTHVVQHKRLAKGGYCYWSGELNDDTYFMVQVLDAIVSVTISEREGELRTKEPKEVACSNEVKFVFDPSIDLYQLQISLAGVSTFIPEFMDKLTFEEIMGIFMWEYASDNVEVYEHLLS
jgi:hypothetical protein